MKISHSKVELFQTCGKKYEFQYIKKLKVDETPAALLFGGSIDKALNYALLRTKRSKEVFPSTAKAIFNKSMDGWYGQNPLVYFKSELPEEQTIEGDSEGNMLRCWANLRNVGSAMIDTYIDEILPMFAKIVSVQTKKEVDNEEGDTLVFITDFVAELLDGRVVLFDNKTSSDVKKQYGKSSVIKSHQLAIYSHLHSIPLSGYIALSKKPKDGKIEWTHVVDTIPETMVDSAFDRIDSSLRAIKREEFEKNEKSCWAYGKKCPFWNACKRNDYSGLIKK